MHEAQKSIREALKLEGISREEERAFSELAGTCGGYPSQPDDVAAPLQSPMDFSGMGFDDDASFAGRLLIKADFRKTVL